MPDAIVQVAPSGATVVVDGADLVLQYVGDAEAARDAAAASASAAAASETLTAAQAATAATQAANATAQAALATTRASDAATSAAAANVSKLDAQAAEAGANSAEAATLAAIAGAGGSLGTVTLQAATRSILAGLNTTLGLSARLLEGNRSGPFKQVAYSAFSAAVDADTDNAVFVRSTTDTTKAWMRDEPLILPEHAGLDAAADATMGLVRLFWLAQTLKRPLWSGGGSVYAVGATAGTNIMVGSLDGTTAPAAGFLNNFKMLGHWRFKVKATKDANFEFRDGNGLTFGDVEWDIVTEATKGSGQLRLLRCLHVEGRTARKIGNATVEATYTASGGSAVSLQAGTEFVHFDEAVVEHAGSLASAVFTLGANNFWFDRIRQVGGQDAFDVSGVSALTTGEPTWGCGELYAEDTDEALDAGNAPGGRIGRIIAKNVNHVISPKTEISGVADLGTNDLKIGHIEVDGFISDIVRMSAGVGTTQTLHGLEIGSVDAKSSVATSTTVAFRFASGDNANDPTHGLKIGRAFIRANAGTTFSMAGMTGFKISDVDSNMPVAMVDPTPSTFRVEDVNGRFDRCRLAGDLTCGLRGVTWNDVVTSGAFILVEPRHGRLFNSGSQLSATRGVDIQWSLATVAAKDFKARGVIVRNCGLGGAANQYGFACRALSGSPTITGVEIDGLLLEDTVRTLAVTSGGTATPAVGDWVLGNTSAARGQIAKVGAPGSGSWAGGDAAATLTLYDVVGEFSAGESLTLGGSQSSADVATASGASASAANTGGVQLIGAFDYCRLINARASANVTNHAANLTFFTGLHSENSPGNRLLDPWQTSSAGNMTVNVTFWNRGLFKTASGNITLPAFVAGSTDWPMGSQMPLVNTSGGTQTLVAAAGVTIVGPTSIPNGKRAIIEQGHVANTYFVGLSA